MPTLSLTDQRIAKHKAIGKLHYLWDQNLRGFGVRVSAAGAKSYVITYRLGSVQRFYTLYSVEKRKVGAARDEARALLADVHSKGADPAAVRAARFNVVTLGDLLERWMVEHSEAENRPATVAKNRALIRRNLSGRFAKLPVADLTDEDVERLKTRLRSKPVEFNRCLSLLRAAYNFAIKRKGKIGGVTNNPCAPVRPYKEIPRERVLSGEELGRIATVLAEMEAEGGNRVAIRAVRFLAMTGWRISEVRRLRWEDLHPDRCEAVLVGTKTGTRTAPVSPDALSLLDDAPHASGNPFIFAGRREGREISYEAINDALHTACERAGVRDVTPHTFRASAAVAMAEAGASVFALRDAFGWKGIAMPNRYVKRAAQSAREAVAQHGARTAAIMSGATPAKVVQLKGREGG